MFTLDKAIFYALFLFACVSTVSMAGQNIAASLALLFVIIKIVKERRVPSLQGLDIKGISVFFGVMALVVFFSTDVKNSASVLLNFFYRFSIFLIAAFYLNSRKQINILIAALIVSITFSDFYAIFEWLNGDKRTAAFFSNPMIFAGCLVLLIPVIVMQTFTESKRVRMATVFSFVLSCAALLANKTRGAWIAVASIPFFMLFLRRHKRYVIYAILVMFILGMGGYFSVPQFQNRVSSIFDLNKKSNSERILLWKSSIEMFKDHPLTGVGLGNFNAQYRAKYVSPQAKHPELPHAHNNFFQMLAETGLLGLSAFCYMFLVFLKQHLRWASHHDEWVRKIAGAAFLFTFTLLVQGLTEYNFSDSAVIRLFWFLTGITYAAYRIFAISEDTTSG